MQALKSKKANNKISTTEISVRFTTSKLRKTHIHKEAQQSSENTAEKNQKPNHYFSKSHNYYPDGNAGNYQGL